MSERIYPFTKNRYFKRKRMRAVDFLREQAGIEHKLSFLNKCCLGSGIALGLDVIRIDSESLLVQAGVGVDCKGRFLIADEPVICRIRTLNGFSKLKGETALLWLHYAEIPFDPMFVADETGEQQEYAAVSEQVAFSLTELNIPQLTGAHKLLFSDTVLFEDNELRVRQVIPRVLSSTGITQIRLIFENYTSDTMEVKLHYNPDFPGFTLSDTGASVMLDKQITLGVGQNITALSIKTATSAQAISACLQENCFTLEKRGEVLYAKNTFREEFTISSGDPLYELENRLNSLSPHALWEDNNDGIPIAAVRFIRYDNNCLLDCIIPLGNEQHITLPYLQERLRQCKDYFSKDEAMPHIKTEPPILPQQDYPKSHSRMTTGIVTLTTGMHQSEENILYSEEIEHMLGPGVVFIEFGVENLYPSVNLRKNCTDLLLGDVSLFEQASGSFEQALSYGVRIHPDKGTFELAVRPHGRLQQSSLRLRWFAWRPDEAVAQPQEIGTLIQLQPDVIHVTPGTVINFVPIFSSKMSQPCDFFVTDKQGGTITRDGVYTAPMNEGLFSISAYARSRPNEQVNAFVIVRQPTAGGEK